MNDAVAFRKHPNVFPNVLYIHQRFSHLLQNTSRLAVSFIPVVSSLGIDTMDFINNHLTELENWSNVSGWFMQQEYAVGNQIVCVDYEHCVPVVTSNASDNLWSFPLDLKFPNDDQKVGIRSCRPVVTGCAKKTPIPDIISDLVCFDSVTINVRKYFKYTSSTCKDVNFLFELIQKWKPKPDVVSAEIDMLETAPDYEFTIHVEVGRPDSCCWKSVLLSTLLKIVDVMSFNTDFPVSNNTPPVLAI